MNAKSWGKSEALQRLAAIVGGVMHNWRSICALGLFAASVLAPPAAVQAKKYNVSDLVHGGTAQNYPKKKLFDFGPKVACGTRCTYSLVSSARMVNTTSTTAGTVAVNAWPPVLALANGVPPTISKDLAVPEDFDDDDGHHVYEGGNVRQRASVTQPATTLGLREVSSESYASGSGSAVMVYNARVSTSDTRFWYIDFRPAKLENAVINAFEVGGPSGEEPMTNYPDWSAMRATMDIYVDGLPVWSGERSHHLLPEFANQVLPPTFEFAWGQRLDGKGKRTLFLGQVPSDSVMNITLVVRVEERVSAPDCPTDYEAFPEPLFRHRCHSQRQTLYLRGKNVRTRGLSPITQLEFDIYSR